MALKYNKTWLVALIYSSLFTLTACDSDTKSQNDNIPPMVTLLGDSTVTIIQNTPFIDDGANAVDNIDGSVTVNISGTVDTKVVGEYIITYSATDSAGNTTTIERIINVEADTRAPVITMTGESPTEVYLGDKYTEAGANALDDVDGEVEVTLSGAVDSNITGSYTITYSATDLTGNLAVLTRIVNVVTDPSRQLLASIDFPDASLKQCVDDNNNSYFYADEFSTLNCSYYGIDNLIGLSYFYNLNHLNIFGNLQSDLALVSNLSQLTFLNAGYNQLTDITFLSSLVKLQTLYLANNSIRDIDALKGLTQLVNLDLNENNGIEDISSIANMSKLEQLQINRNRIRNVTPLAELEQLNLLTLYSNNIGDISDLTKLINLVVLNLASNNITDVSPLASLKEVVELKLLNNDINTGVDTLTAFDKLEVMYLNGNNNIPCHHLDTLGKAYDEGVISMPEKCADIKE